MQSKGIQMLALQIFLYILTFALFIFVAYMVWRNLLNIEKAICMYRKQPIFLPSNQVLRNAVILEINTHYPDMKTACEIGSGYGGLARAVANKCNMRVVALENMPFVALASKIADIMTRRNSRTIYQDAFKYIKKSDGFDIAIAYFGPQISERLDEIKSKIKVLISLSFPVKGMTPVREVALPKGFTRYGSVKYPHRLFIYEF